MAVIQFNVPQITIVPVLDINGDPVLAPSPITITGLQGLDLTMKSSIKQLITGKQFAIAGTRGEATIDGKIKAVENTAQLISSLYTGQGYDTSEPFQAYGGPSTGTVTTNTITVGPASAINTGTGNVFLEDLGVTDQYGNPLINIASGAPTAGHYKYALASGVATYTFAAADISGGLIPYIAFLYEVATPATGTQAVGLNINNLQGGQTPVLKLVIATSFQGRKLTLIFPWTISSNLNFLATKNLEFSGFEIDFSCFPERTVEQNIMTGFFLQ